MMDFETLFQLKSSQLVVGLCGAFVSILHRKDIEPWLAFLLIIAGGLTAAYLTEAIAEWIHVTNEPTKNSLSFIVGLFGMKVTEVVFSLLDTVKKNGQAILNVAISFFKKK